MNDAEGRKLDRKNVEVEDEDCVPLCANMTTSIYEVERVAFVPPLPPLSATHYACHRTALRLVWHWRYIQLQPN